MSMMKRTLGHSMLEGGGDLGDTLSLTYPDKVEPRAAHSQAVTLANEVKI